MWLQVPQASHQTQNATAHWSIAFPIKWWLLVSTQEDLASHKILITFIHIHSVWCQAWACLDQDSVNLVMVTGHISRIITCNIIALTLREKTRESNVDVLNVNKCIMVTQIIGKCLTLDTIHGQTPILIPRINLGTNKDLVCNRAHNLCLTTISNHQELIITLMLHINHLWKHLVRSSLL